MTDLDRYTTSCRERRQLQWHADSTGSYHHAQYLVRVVCLSEILREVNISSRQIMRDERYFPEPEEFKPERFAEKPENAASEEIFNPFNSVFGFGRRYAFIQLLLRPFLNRALNL